MIRLARLTGSFTTHMTDLPGRANVAVPRTLHTSVTAIVASGSLVALRSGLKTSARKEVDDGICRLVGLPSAALGPEPI